MPDIQKLYDAKIIDIQDKHEKLLVGVLVQGQIFKLVLHWKLHILRERPIPGNMYLFKFYNRNIRKGVNYVQS